MNRVLAVAPTSVLFFILFLTYEMQRTKNERVMSLSVDTKIESITLDGGSLGSSVDEERSQLRESMRIAEHREHQYFERTLQHRAFPALRLSEGRLHIVLFGRRRTAVHLGSFAGLAKDPSSPRVQSLSCSLFPSTT